MPYKTRKAADSPLKTQNKPRFGGLFRSKKGQYLKAFGCGILETRFTHCVIGVWHRCSVLLPPPC